MKTRISASNITNVLDISTAQAETDFSTNDLDVIYSGLNPNFTRDPDINGSYTASLQPGICEKVGLQLDVVKNDFNAQKVTYIVACNTVACNTERFASANLQFVCL